ncbi:hypothetical protein [Nocardia pseudobrasiliensis]|uniref:Uncharacterized protein n=1 Tax=Nocardia pseudobrasiliensis TaxID=45979 RepID=A0A370I8D5_9NOCA|nr:hypothetical protein [Nocardia pseudobrasiliensis]RDI66995.1 hypothetical protein DFR76_10366 [Nocardia pseudobrasiliensis]
MIVHPSTPESQRDEGESAEEAVVWPDPSPLASWWAQVMKPSGDRRAGGKRMKSA